RRWTAACSAAPPILWRLRPNTTSTRADDMPHLARARRTPDQITTGRAKATGPDGPRAKTAGSDPAAREIPKRPPSQFTGFLVHDVLADDRVVLAELEPLLAVVLVLLREIAVVAGLALQLDDEARFLPLRHGSN